MTIRHETVIGAIQTKSAKNISSKLMMRVNEGRASSFLRFSFSLMPSCPIQDFPKSDYSIKNSDIRQHSKQHTRNHRKSKMRLAVVIRDYQNNRKKHDGNRRREY